MNRRVLAVALSAVATGAVWLQFSAGRAEAEATHGNVELQKVSVDEVEKLVGNASVTIVDANSASLYAKGHVPGAINVGFDDVSEKTLPKNKDSTVVFYCMNEMCSASVMAAQKAVALGYTGVKHMPAGIQGWIKAEKAVEKGAGQS
jgi:rhodanese-related sulfurtransferase